MKRNRSLDRFSRATESEQLGSFYVPAFVLSCHLVPSGSTLHGYESLFLCLLAICEYSILTGEFVAFGILSTMDQCTAHFVPDGT